MPRIIVTADLRSDQTEPAVLLDELVSSVHLSTDHASAQFVERVAWAVNDAEHLEGEQQGPTAADHASPHSASQTPRLAA
jgi:hypothetical protein